jgi:hypothetical protein
MGVGCMNVFELLSDGRVLAAGRIFRLTADGVAE